MFLVVFDSDSVRRWKIMMIRKHFAEDGEYACLIYLLTRSGRSVDQDDKCAVCQQRKVLRQSR